MDKKSKSKPKSLGHDPFADFADFETVDAPIEETSPAIVSETVPPSATVLPTELSVPLEPVSVTPPTVAPLPPPESETTHHRKTTGVLNVYDRQNKQVVAKIILNGYNIEKSNQLGQRGAMRSFKVVEGSLWDEWDAQRPLILHGEDDQEAKIKVAALPAEEDSFGLIEFI